MPLTHEQAQEEAVSVRNFVQTMIGMAIGADIKPVTALTSFIAASANTYLIAAKVPSREHYLDFCARAYDVFSMTPDEAAEAANDFFAGLVETGQTKH